MCFEVYMFHTCSITTFLSTSLTTCLKWKNKNTFNVRWMKLCRNFFPTNVCFLMWPINNEGENKLKRRKHFLWQKFPLRECVYVGNLSITHMSQLLTFVLWKLTSYLLILKSDLHLSKKLCYLLDWKPFKNDEKCFLFCLKSSFRSQGI